MINLIQYIINCWITNREHSIRKFYQHPGVTAHEHGDLVLFKYSRDYWYEVGWNPKTSWDPVARAARGIIFNRKTGELLAKPWDKFFNLNQVPESKLDNLPTGPFSTTMKIDGCLGVSYWYKGQLHMASSGLLNSDIAEWGTKWARENLKTENFDQNYTYLFEVVHPEHKIVIDYGSEEKLILTSIIHTKTSKEATYEHLMEYGNLIDCEVTEYCFFDSIEDIIKECETLPFNEEGYVVTFANGLKVKIKGKEYSRIHKIIADLTPLSFWRGWDRSIKEVPKNFVENMPDEFRDEIDGLYLDTNRVHREYADKIIAIYNKVVSELGKDCPAQVFYPYIKKNYRQENRLLMSYHSKSMDRFWYFVHMQVRPTDNKWPDITNN